MEWSLFSNNRELIKTGRWEMMEDGTRIMSVLNLLFSLFISRLLLD